MAGTLAGAMRLRSSLWFKFRPSQEHGQQPPDPSLSQEDEETRAVINHYLRLADLALSAEIDQESAEGSDDQVA